jgi:hypothetical protein
MNNPQQRIAVIISRWPWEPGKIPQGWDIQGQLRRQGGEVSIAPIVAALEALAKRQAIRVGSATPPGAMTILEVFPARLQEIVP